MGEIRIRLLQEVDTEDLYKFELDNRTFFESMVPSRGDRYYDPKNFKEIVRELVEEQENRLIYMYIIKDSMDHIIGRVNLVSILRGSVNKAELGYRIGKAYKGKGYATKAVSLVLEEAVNLHKLHRIEAGTSPDNIGSQIVLIKNGFQFTGRYRQSIYQGGEWKDSINFEKILI